MERTSPVGAVASAVRRERERHGLSLAELARRAGLAKSTLSQLESGSGNPGIETLWALAVALGVPFSRLVDFPAEEIRVIRAGEGASIPAERSAYAATMLAACPPGARRDLHLICAEPGSPRCADPHIPGTVEHLVIVAGRWRAGPRDGTVDLEPGDYVRFAGDRPHRYEALVPACVAVLVMEYG